MERYEGQRQRTTEPMVSIRKQGHIALNHKAMTEWEFDAWKYVQLYYDKDKRIIALARTDTKAPGTRKIHRVATGGVITCDAFLRYYKIPYEQTRKYEPYENQIDMPGIMLIDLNDAH